jgi:hypothetical protein
VAEIRAEGDMACPAVEDGLWALSLLLGRLPSLAPPVDDEPSTRSEMAADGFGLRCESAVAEGDASVRA